MTESLGVEFPYAGETPTEWLRAQIPSLRYYVFRRGWTNRDGTSIWNFECVFGGRDRSKENGHKTKRTKHKCESKFKVTQNGEIAKIAAKSRHGDCERGGATGTGAPLPGAVSALQPLSWGFPAVPPHPCGSPPGRSQW